MTNNWQQLQTNVADVFKHYGFSVLIDQYVTGARSRHKVDVYATQHRGSLSHAIVVECKCWHTPIKKAHALTLQGVVEDTGATLGIIVATGGVQAGCQRFIESHTNLRVIPPARLESDVRAMNEPDFLTFSRIYNEGARVELAKRLRCSPSAIDSWPPVWCPGGRSVRLLHDDARNCYVALKWISDNETWLDTKQRERIRRDQFEKIPINSLRDLLTGSRVSVSEAKKFILHPIGLDDQQYRDLSRPGTKVVDFRMLSIRRNLVLLLTLKTASHTLIELRLPV